jgi:hypothetical protein
VYRTDDDAAVGGGDILAIRPGVDSVPLTVAATEFEETSPSFSPDGKWIAYSSDQSGRKEVYVVSFPDVQREFAQVSSEGGNEPLWAHNGRELFYSDAYGMLKVAEFETTPNFRVRSRTPMFSRAGDYFRHDDHRMFDITSDDQRFLMIRAIPASGAEIILVENFFEDVKAKVGND